MSGMRLKQETVFLVCGMYENLNSVLCISTNTMSTYHSIVGCTFMIVMIVK